MVLAYAIEIALFSVLEYYFYIPFMGILPINTAFIGNQCKS